MSNVVTDSGLRAADLPNAHNPPLRLAIARLSRYSVHCQTVCWRACLPLHRQRQGLRAHPRYRRTMRASSVSSPFSCLAAYIACQNLSCRCTSSSFRSSRTMQQQPRCVPAGCTTNPCSVALQVQPAPLRQLDERFDYETCVYYGQISQRTCWNASLRMFLSEIGEQMDRSTGYAPIQIHLIAFNSRCHIAALSFAG